MIFVRAEEGERRRWWIGRRREEEGRRGRRAGSVGGAEQKGSTVKTKAAQPKRRHRETEGSIRQTITARQLCTAPHCALRARTCMAMHWSARCVCPKKKMEKKIFFVHFFLSNGRKNIAR